MRLTLLGSTGSIGTQTLDVARERGYRVVALAAGRNLELLETQVHEFRPEVVSVAREVYSEARQRLPDVRVIADTTEIAVMPADVTVNAMSGLLGLAPTRAALQAGRSVALATKEAMVTAGMLIWEAAAEGGGRLVPVDSEHTGIYQCLSGESVHDVAELILTASGGPFRDGPADLGAVTPAQALKHPNWDMGRKISIDSATLLNKGLEVLECASLYGVPLSRVRVTVHPQSIVHALVRFRDGSLKANLGPTDMRLAIAYALDAASTGMQRPGQPGLVRRGPEVAGHLSWPLTGTLEFREPDLDRFPALALSYRAGELGGVAPAALNAADEVAVEAFLDGRLDFLGIARVIESVLDETPSAACTWDTLEDTDRWARQRTAELIARPARAGAHP